MWTHLRRHSLQAWHAIRAVIGYDESLLCAGLTLITIGAWPVLAWGSLVIPGAVLVWMALPRRVPFIGRDERPKKGQ